MTEPDECRYCREDGVGLDALGRWACEEHIEETKDDLLGNAHEHEGGNIEGGFIYCSHAGCRARAAITDGEAAKWIWTEDPVELDFVEPPGQSPT